MLPPFFGELAPQGGAVDGFRVGIIWDETTQTDASGKFLFKNLPVGKAMVSDGLGNSKGADWEDHYVSDDVGNDLDDVFIQSGQTVWVVLGEPGASHAE